MQSNSRNCNVFIIVIAKAGHFLPSVAFAYDAVRPMTWSGDAPCASCDLLKLQGNSTLTQNTLKANKCQKNSLHKETNKLTPPQAFSWVVGDDGLLIIIVLLVSRAPPSHMAPSLPPVASLRPHTCRTNGTLLIPPYT